MLACFSLHVPSFRSLASTSLVWTLDLLDFQAAFKAIGTKPLPAILLTIAHTAYYVFMEGCRRQTPLAALEVCVKQVVWRPDSVGMTPVLRRHGATPCRRISGAHPATLLPTWTQGTGDLRKSARLTHLIWFLWCQSQNQIDGL
jgi:hypothetical protein